MKLKQCKNLFEPKVETIVYNGETFTFKMVPLPINFIDKLETLAPSPEPPKNTEPIRDGKGRFIKDERGSLIYDYNYNSAEYKKKLRETQTLQTAIMLYESLKFDSNIEWNVGEFRDNIDFYKKIVDSMVENIPIGLYSKLIEKVNQVSSIGINSAIEDAKKN